MPNRLRKNLSGATSSLDIIFAACESTLSKQAASKKVADWRGDGGRQPGLGSRGGLFFCHSERSEESRIFLGAKHRAPIRGRPPRTLVFPNNCASTNPGFFASL